MMIKDQDQESDDSDRQDVEVDSPEESEHESDHSCHDPSHMSTMRPQIFGDFLAAEVASH